MEKTKSPSQEYLNMNFYSEEARSAQKPNNTTYGFLYERNLPYMNNIAISFGNVDIKYEQLHEEIDKYARALYKRGVREGDIIGLSAINTPELIYITYALNKLGAIICSINPMDMEYKIMQDLKVVRPKMFIGINDGGAVIIGKTVGEGKETLAYNYAKKLAISVPALSLFMGVTIILLRKNVISLFNLSGNITPATLSVVDILVIIYGAEIALRNIPYTMICAVFRPGGDSVTGAKYDMICLWALAIPVTYFLAFHVKLAFPLVFLTEYLVEDIPKVIVCIKHFVSKKWIKSVVR